MTAKWDGNAWKIAPLPTIPMVGAGTEEEEEPEEPQEKDNSLDAMMQRVATEPDHEREEIFRDLKEFRRQKKLNPWVGRQEQERLEMRTELDSTLREIAERSTRETTNGAAMANNGGVISYVKDGNGKLVRSPARSRSPADNIHDVIYYVSDENGDLVPYVPPPRRFTHVDRARANKNRSRYTRAMWCKRLRAIADGSETVSKEQLQAHLAYGGPGVGTCPRRPRDSWTRRFRAFRIWTSNASLKFPRAISLPFAVRYIENRCLEALCCAVSYCVYVSRGIRFPSPTPMYQ